MDQHFLKALMLDLDQILATAANPERLLSFNLVEHDEGPVTTVFDFDNSDHTLPAPPDGETAEAVIHEPPDMAFVTYATIGTVLRVSCTYTVPAEPHPLADIECLGGMQ